LSDEFSLNPVILQVFKGIVDDVACRQLPELAAGSPEVRKIWILEATEDVCDEALATDLGVWLAFWLITPDSDEGRTFGTAGRVVARRSNFDEGKSWSKKPAG
jgi:hypothetical protein